MMVTRQELSFVTYKKHLIKFDLLSKLKQKGISGSLLNIMTDFLSLRKQRIFLNGQLSTWVNIEARVP